MKNNLPEKILFLLILFHWILPNQGVIDNIGSQWLYLSVINSVALLYNLTKGRLDKDFLKINKLYIAPILLFFWGFTGMFNSINQSEVIIESGRYLNVILAFFNFYLLQKSIKSLNFILYSVLFFLLYEVLILYPKFYESFISYGYIKRENIGSGISSNINITTYSILLKIPLIILLYLKTNRIFLKRGILLISFISFFSISVFATRSALLCIFLFIICFLPYLIFKKKLEMLKTLTKVILIPFIISITLNSFIQENSSDNSIDRVLSLTEKDDKSSSNRISYYKEAFKEFTEEPVFGVGLGNYKIHSARTILNSERYYTLPYHTHNDFLQVLSELSVIGLLLYLIFIYGGALFLIIKKKINTEVVVLLSVLIIYTFDATFNFPHARPIIQIILALLLALIALKTDKLNLESEKYNFTILLFILWIFNLGSIYINHRVFNSMIEQNIFASDMSRGVYSRSAEIIKTFEEDFPTLNTSTIPIKALKANYYSFSEPDLALKKLDEAIKDNPKILFPQVLKTQIYMRQSKIDSAYNLSKIVFNKGPTIEFHAISHLNIIGFLNKKEDLDHVYQKLKHSDSDVIWTKYINTLFEVKKDGVLEADKKIINELTYKFPNNRYFKNLKSTSNLTFTQLKQLDSIDKSAKNHFSNKNFLMAQESYLELYNLHNKESSYVKNLIKCYFTLGDYVNAKIYLEKLYNEFGIDNGFKEYYLGSIEIKEGTGNGCDNFFKSYDKGFKNGEIMYRSFCLNKKTKSN